MDKIEGWCRREVIGRVCDKQGIQHFKAEDVTSYRNDDPY